MPTIVAPVVVQSVAVAANTVLAGPTSGSAAVPSFRTLTGADLASTLVDNETVSGSGTSWTLAHIPATGCVPILVWMSPSFGGIILLKGQTPGFTISGATITTTSSYSASSLFAWYRF